MAFQIGDKVKVHRDIGNSTGYKQYDSLAGLRTVSAEGDSSNIRVDGPDGEYIGLFEEHELELIKGDNMSDQVTAKQIRDANLSVDDQLLLDAGIVDSSGTITGDGQDVVLQVLFDANKDAIVAAVQAIVAARKATATK